MQMEWLIGISLVLPLVWGWVSYRIVIAVWPARGDGDSGARGTSPHAGMPPPDYQI